MKIYSVTEFREEINDLLGQITIVIQGEVSEFNISQGRFVWFAIKDEETSVKCFMMAFQLRVPIEDGMEVRLVGSPTMFKKGQFVFRPRQVELVGEGSLKQAYEMLQKKLQAEGLFDEDRKRELPRFPKRIAVVTSRDAAAYTDVLRILKNRWSGLKIVHRHVQVQGVQAVGSIVEALQQLNAEEKELDCIILTRGGGSMEDLQAFNDEEVVRAIFASHIPVISGVGHERDTTLSDLVADIRASTPSNAAEIVVPDKTDVIAEIEYMEERMDILVQTALRDKKDMLDRMVYVLEQGARRQLDSCTVLDQRLQFAFQSFQERISAKKESVIAMSRLLQSLHPEQLLQKGFTVTIDGAGNILTSSKTVTEGDTVITKFSDGEVTSIVSK